jgi:hypothetical protein
MSDKSVSFLLEPVECGETRCFDKNNKKMCRFVRSTRFGQYWYCGIFNEDLLSDEEDYLERCKQCLAAEKDTIKD